MKRSTEPLRQKGLGLHGNIVGRLKESRPLTSPHLYANAVESPFYLHPSLCCPYVERRLCWLQREVVVRAVSARVNTSIWGSTLPAAQSKQAGVMDSQQSKLRVKSAMAT